MGSLDWLRARMVATAGTEAMVWRDAGYRHADLLALWDEAARALDGYGVGPGRVVSLEADYAPTPSRCCSPSSTAPRWWCR